MKIKELAKHSATRFLSSTFLSVPVSLITGFFTFRYIEPENLGLWNSLLILEVYAPFLGIGITNGMARELPFRLGQGNLEKAHLLAKTALFFVLVTIGVTLLAGVPSLLAFGNSSEKQLAGVFILLRLVVLPYTTYLSSTFRSDDQFNRLSNIMLIVLLVRLFAAPLSMSGFRGFLLYDATVNLTNVVLLHFYRPFKIRPKWDKSSFIELVSIGFPLFISSFLIGFFDSFFRLYLVNFGSYYELGLYATILILVNNMTMIPNTLSTYLYPKFSFEFGKTGKIDGIWKKLNQVYLATLFGVGGICAVAYFLMDWAITFFPKYQAALPFLKLALLFCPFLFYRLGNTVHVMLKRNDLILGFVVVCGIVQAGALGIFHFTDLSAISKVIWAQLVSILIIIAVGFGMNRYAIKTYENGRQ